jgi:hypothetical protein
VYCQLINYYLKCIFDIYIYIWFKEFRENLCCSTRPIFFSNFLYSKRSISSIYSSNYPPFYLYIVGSTLGRLLLNLLCLSLLLQWSRGDEHRLNYGIVFQKMQDVQLASENWIHTCKIDIPEEIRIQTINYYDNRSSAAILNNAMFQIETKAKNPTPHEYDPKTNFQPYTRLTCGNRTF